MESYFISEIPLMGNDVVRWQAQAIEKFVYAEPTEERLEVLRNISQHAHDLPVELLWFVGIRGLQDQDHRIRGEVCYALGRSGMPFFVPLLEPLTSDANDWVCRQARKALRTLAPEPITGEDAADSHGLSRADTEGKLHCLDRVASRVSRFPGPLLGALIQLVLNDSDAQVRARACSLTAGWGAINRQGATRLTPLIRQISVRDHVLKVRRQATIALKELEDIEESKIELALVTAENTYQSLKVHLPTLRKRKRIIEFQISNLEWRIQDTRSNGDRLRLRDECARKQRSLDELERMIQRIQGPLVQDRRSI